MNRITQKAFSKEKILIGIGVVALLGLLGVGNAFQNLPESAPTPQPEASEASVPISEASGQDVGNEGKASLENEHSIEGYTDGFAFVRDKKLHLAISDTLEERQQGLSGRQELPDMAGMLFVFEKSGFKGFWMKDMRFAIDILWLDTEGVIVHRERNVLPESFPEVLKPDEEALYVLEVASGASSELGLIVGSRVELEL